MRRVPLVAAGKLGLVLAFAACGGSHGGSSAAPASSPGMTAAAMPVNVATATAASSNSAGGNAAAPSAGAGAAPTIAAANGGSASPPMAAMSNTAPAMMSSAAGAAEPPATMSASAGVGGMSSMPAANDDSPMPSAGCMNGTLKAGRIMGSIQSSGGERTYIQYLPSSYDGTKPVPLVVDLHPFSVGASFAEMSSGFKPLADTEGYAYLAPQGEGNMWDSTGDTDEKFIRDLVNDVAMHGCIDLRRVYATGCSNGGAFTFLLMCTAEDIFAAVAPMCGTAFFDLETMCMMDRPVSLMLRIGKQDTLNCWEGEGMTLDAPNVPAGTKVECAKTVQKIMSDKYHCKGQPMMKDECEYVADCDEGTQIAICDEDTGHVVYTANTASDTYAFLKQFYKH